MLSSNSFTLIETIVVIAIVAILAGATYGAILSLRPSMELKSVVRDIATDLRYAQQQAMTEQVNFVLSFFPETKEYQIKRYATTTENIALKSLPESVDFNEITGFTNNEVVFNPYGAVLEMGTMSLLNSKGDIETIEIRPSGFVRVK